MTRSIRIRFGTPWLLAVILATGTHAAMAADGAPATATTGSATTMINGKPAQRAGDQTGDGAVAVELSSNVFIDGKPAAIGGGCANGAGGGSSNVFINGKPAAIGAGAPCPK